MILFLFILFFFKFSLAGEIDGKGLICKIYGDTIGYFFENDRTFEYKPSGGNEKLELSRKILENIIPMKIVFISEK